MLQSNLLQQAATRHANFYREKLKLINGLYTQGGLQSQSALTMFDSHWSQIVHAHHWTTQQETNTDALRLCSDYFKSGQQILYSRLTVSDHIAWLKAGVKAAVHLNDHNTVISYMCDLGQAYLVSRDVDECIEQYSHALTLAQKNNDSQGQVKAHIGLGRVKSLSRASADEARQHLQEAINISYQIEDRLNAGWGLQNLATLEERYGDIDHALHLMERALTIFQTEESPRHIANALKRIGAILERVERFDEALIHLSSALTIGQSLDDPHIVCSTHMVMGLIYSYQNKMDESRIAYEEALDIAQKAGLRSDMATAYVNLGWISREAQAWEDAEGHYQSALAIYQAMKYQTRYLAVMGNLALISVLRGDYDKAHQQFRIILAESSESAVEVCQALSVIGLAHLRQLAGDWQMLAQVLGCLEKSLLRRDYDVDEYWQIAHKNLKSIVPEAMLEASKAHGREQEFSDFIAIFRAE